jgi:hypothetical protein
MNTNCTSCQSGVTQTGNTQSDISNITDLSLSTNEVASIIENYTSTDSSPETQNLINLYLNERYQKTTFMSNMWRMFSDGANQIIRNIRA